MNRNMCIRFEHATDLTHSEEAVQVVCTPVAQPSLYYLLIIQITRFEVCSSSWLQLFRSVHIFNLH